MRVMIFIDATTYSESVISTPSIGWSASVGPMQNGMTYIVRPRMLPRYRSVIVVFISAGSTQLLVGPGAVLGGRTDEGAFLDAGDVVGIGGGPERVGLLLLVQLDEGARVDEAGRHAVPLVGGAVAPHDAVGHGQVRDLAHPGEESIVLGRRRIEPWHGRSRHGALLRK